MRDTLKDTLNCIKKYIEITNNEEFIRHWKQLSEELHEGIRNKYNQREPKIVKIVESIINKIGQFSTERDNINIYTNSIFIHGNKSQVKFKYYKRESQRELGDIIFILSVVYNNKKFFEKMTINQVKKSKNTSWNFNNSSAKEQLYLLSKFPIFKGVNNSLIPEKDYELPNYSGCLGSHGLLYYPGDFALISSKLLDIILLEKNKLKFKDLVLSTSQNDFCIYCCYLYYRINIEECFHIFYKLLHFYPLYIRYPYVMHCSLPILGNCCISYNAYDFSDKYLRGLIGELIYAKNLSYNKSAFQFLQNLLHAIEKKAKKEKSDNVLNFIKSFYKYSYDIQEDKEYTKNNYEGENNYKGGGIGIVHTIVNLGRDNNGDTRVK